MISVASVLTVNPSRPEEAAIDEAVRILASGGLVAFPTETVYGLAADASNPKAVERLNQVKGRPPDKPYSIHLGDAAQVARFVRDVPPAARRLMQKFWPGPLTIVLPADGQKTVGFRLPNHPVAVEFLRRCACPVIAPSANKSGFPPPTDGREVLGALDGQLDCLLDAGPTPLGRESSVVSVVDGVVTVLREGAIPAGAIQAAAKE